MCARPNQDETGRPLLGLEHVNRHHCGSRVAALTDVTASFCRGEFVAISGPSGSGKSTLLHLLCGLDRPTRGRVFFDGRVPVSVPEWTRIRAERVGFVFQGFHLLPMLTALENVEIPMFGITRGAGARRARARELLNRVGLASQGDRRPGALSGGECQRVAIARSLANHPSAILADEPTGNLDSRTGSSILDLLDDLRCSTGACVVVASHDDSVSRRAERIVRLFDGRIVSGEPATASSLSAEDRVS